MTDINHAEMSITLNGKETLDILNRLCAITGITPACLIALLVRKYGQDLESWLGYSESSTQNHSPQINQPKVEFPTDPGNNLSPVEL
jgi:hypothetical protein